MSIYQELRKNAQTLYARNVISQDRCVDLMGMRPGGFFKNKLHEAIAWCAKQAVEKTNEIQKEAC